MCSKWKFRSADLLLKSEIRIFGNAFNVSALQFCSHSVQLMLKIKYKHYHNKLLKEHTIAIMTDTSILGWT
jgi:hypothetical protein